MQHQPTSSITLASRLRALHVLPALLLALTSAACSSSDPEDPPVTNPPIDLSPLGGDRPVDPYVPASYTPGAPAPLVVLLHGYGASGLLQELVFRLRDVAEERGFLYLTPDGTLDSGGKRFWNATDACCDFEGAGVDDVAYLRDLIDEAKARFTVDPRRVYLVGHSNGGFMAHRMACDEAGVIAGIASLAGSTWSDPAKCKPEGPVAMLQIHGTEDTSVLYEGEMGERSYPGARATTAQWAALDGCAGAADTSPPPVDFSPDVEGPETTVERYASGCAPGGRAELWTMVGERHVPGLNDSFSPAVVDFLLANPKP